MTDRSIVHSTFTVQRTYPHSAAHVFKAFADQKTKDKWFKGPDGYQMLERTFDFRVGGEEVAVGRHGPSHGGQVSAFYAVYQDIVDNERIVYSYRMSMDGAPISVSLASIELSPDGAGTRVVITEDGVFLDGYEDGGSREHGTGWLLEQVGKSLETETA